MDRSHQAVLDAALERTTPDMAAAERARLLSDLLLDSGIEWRHEPLLEDAKQLFMEVMRVGSNGAAKRKLSMPVEVAVGQ